jgi:predicted GIY-YIG superfamily endonuclease
MSKKFHDKINTLINLYEELIQCPLMLATEATKAKGFPNTGGIYLFYEAERPLYVGRTDNLKRRVRIHKTSDYNGASFAFKLAKEMATNRGLDLSPAKNKKELALYPEFNKYFNEAKIRIAVMQVKHVRIDDPITQLLLEPYVHLSLDTPYNDFNNH